ncbi:DUF4129 domain-containing protein [Sphingomonas sp. SUN039]|uniref:DUF4129 domain-containing protein n=1 Tax=Sphingomonas sp. SUN039 TaxID=2937787 RepID=UPI00216496F3|nr:DUF4129 domain-containing protein [Sphingomonas sp. SUN039]UVO55683.1 hypothetical protein M0209_16770 [Sphingomonas sp. SUN039]
MAGVGPGVGSAAERAAIDGRFDAAHRALIADKSIQFDLAPMASRTPPKLPEWLRWIGDFLQWLSPAFPYIFWGAIILAVLTVLYFVLSNVDGFEWPWARGSRDRNAVIEEDWRPEEGAARALLAEAEALAAQGRYAEAARLLLLRSVEDISRRLPQFLKPSLTARDIAAAQELPGAARPAFDAIARVVEVSAFGSRSVNEAAWAECRAAYARFATPATWSAAHG